MQDVDMREEMYRRRRGDLIETDSVDEEFYASPITSRKRTHSLSDDDQSSGVDFSSVSLYLPALQTMLALIIASLASIAASALSAFMASNAIRTIVITSMSGVLILIKPIRASHARGVDVMFDALRPSMLIYVVALVCEQLLHSCRPAYDDEEAHAGVAREIVFHIGVLFMIGSGYYQALNPKEQTDYPFIVTFVTLLILTFFVPSPHSGMGPLCDVPSAGDAIERVLRSLAFAWTYITTAYAMEPTRHNIGEILLCATRASAGSIWTLCCNRWVLVVSLIQGLIVVIVRVRNGRSKSNDYDTHNLMDNMSTESSELGDDDFGTDLPDNFDAGVAIGTPTPGSIPEMIPAATVYAVPSTQHVPKTQKTQLLQTPPMYSRTLTHTNDGGQIHGLEFAKEVLLRGNANVSTNGFAHHARQ